MNLIKELNTLYNLHNVFECGDYTLIEDVISFNQSMRQTEQSYNDMYCLKMNDNIFDVYFSYKGDRKDLLSKNIILKISPHGAKYTFIALKNFTSSYTTLLTPTYRGLFNQENDLNEPNEIVGICEKILINSY